MKNNLYASGVDLKPFGVQETELNNMDLLHQLDQKLESAKEDADKFYNKGNKTAGTRLRAKMQDIKNLATSVRKDVIEKKNS